MVFFATFTDKAGKRLKRYQYTAIDDATRARALRIYTRHNQKCAVDFADYVRERFPFRIHTVQTDNANEKVPEIRGHCPFEYHPR